MLMIKSTKLFLTGAAVLTLSACAQTEATPPTSSSSSAQLTNASTAVGRLSTDEAKALAFQAAQVTEEAVSNLTVQEDLDNGRAVYEIDFTHDGKDYSYTVSATDGTLLERETERADATTVTAVTAEQAKSIALTDAGLAEASVTNLTITQDTEQMKTVYEVDFVHDGKAYSYAIDATTGLVLSKEHELAGN